MSKVESSIITQFDSLIIALKTTLEREKATGRIVPNSPEMDYHLETLKQKAGSPPPNRRT